MKELHLRPRSSLLLGYLVIGASTVCLSAPAPGGEDAQDARDPAVACQKLATLANLPVTPTEATCLSPAQINAIKKINRGPRNSLGVPIKGPASAAVREPIEAPVFGYVYDGGFMEPTGIPSRKIGTPTATPGDFALGLGQIPYIWLSPPNPGRSPLSFDFDKDVENLNKSTPLVSYGVDEHFEVQESGRQDHLVP